MSNSHISVSFSLIWNWNDKYVDTIGSSVEKRTWFKTKMAKVYTCFQMKTVQKPTWWGGTYLYSLYKGVPLPWGGGNYRKPQLCALQKEQESECRRALIAKTRGFPAFSCLGV